MLRFGHLSAKLSMSPRCLLIISRGNPDIEMTDWSRWKDGDTVIGRREPRLITTPSPRHCSSQDFAFQSNGMLSPWGTIHFLMQPATCHCQNAPSRCDNVSPGTRRVTAVKCLPSDDLSLILRGRSITRGRPGGRPAGYITQTCRLWYQSDRRPAWLPTPSAGLAIPCWLATTTLITGQTGRLH